MHNKQQMNLELVRHLTATTHTLMALSYVLVVLAFIGQFLNLSALVCIVLLLLALIQHYVYIRLQFDRRLLHLLATASDEAAFAEQTAHLDQGLLALNLIASDKCNRPWDLRLNGILQLFKVQCAVVLLQAILLMVFMFLGCK